MKINELAAVIFSMFIVKFLYDAPIDAVFILPIFFIGFYLLFKLSPTYDYSSLFSTSLFVLILAFFFFSRPTFTIGILILMVVFLFYNYPIFLFKKGFKCYTENDFKCALRYYDKALAFYKKVKPISINVLNEPIYMLLFFNKGEALFTIGNYEGALNYFNKALNIHNDNGDVWNNKGLTLEMLNRDDEAIIAYDNAINYDSDNDLYYCNKGTVLKKLNRNDESLDCFNKALKINPENKNALKAKKELN